jgi:hypothetical protein
MILFKTPTYWNHSLLQVRKKLGMFIGASREFPYWDGVLGPYGLSCGSDTAENENKES